MAFQRDVFAAFMASGAVWTIGASGASRDPVVAVVMGAYVLVGSVVLALVEGQRWIAFAVLWGSPTGLLAILAASAGDVLGAVVVAFVGAVFGTVGFALWVGCAFLLLHLFVPRRRTVL